jgi:DNA primase
MAGRIPQNFIDDLLTRIDIIDVIDGYVPLRKAGKNHQARCPFHEEKTPSFTVSQDKQFYHCFGCSANGTAITFLMEYGGMDFVEAIEELASRVGLQVPREGTDIPHKDSGNAELYELMEMVVRFYGQQLREHPQAQNAIDYLKQRGISGELAAAFELGFAPPGWDNLLHSHGGSDAAHQRLAKAGMTLKKESGGYYDRFRNRIMYPIRDQRGRVIGFGGRVLDDNETPKYLNSPETSIFQKGHELYGLYQAKQKLKDLKKLYIVEGYMDVLALAQYEINNSVATLGTAVTQEHLQSMFRVCSKLVFCFDGDSAGKKAAWRAVDIALPLLRDGRQCHFLFFPEGDDPDSYVRSHGRDEFENTTAHVPLSKFLLDTLKQEIDLSTSEGRALLAEKSIPYLGKLPANALRELLLSELATQSKLSVNYLKESLSNNIKNTHPKKTRPHINATPKRNLSNLIGEAIHLLLHHPQLAITVNPLEKMNNIDMPGMDFLLELLTLIEQKPNINCAGILEHWRDSKYEYRLRELATTENLLSTAEQYETEFRDVISKIKQSHQKQQQRTQSQNVGSLDELRSLYSDGAEIPNK